MRDFSLMSDPDGNPAFRRPWRDGAPPTRIRFARESKRKGKASRRREKARKALLRSYRP